MSEQGFQVTPTVELPPMHLAPRLFKDEVCLQAVESVTNLNPTS